ncbi:MAG: hypothetical protein ACM34J_09675, partial [Ignavibacteria bacterium]
SSDSSRERDIIFCRILVNLKIPWNRSLKEWIDRKTNFIFPLLSMRKRIKIFHLLDFPLTLKIVIPSKTLFRNSY